jgi:predicted GNAT family acetyltransferase
MPPDATPPAPKNVGTYAATFTTDRAWFERVQAAIDSHVTEQQWDQLATELVPGSMVFVERDKEPVAVACALKREDEWRELTWVAVALEHRGKRLGKIVCSARIRELLDSGEQRILGSTRDERLTALRIYLEIGFHPVQREDKVERWHAICNNLA